MKPHLLLALSTLLVTSARAESLQVPQGLPADTVARVGDEVITYSQLNTELNSAAVVGLSVPVLGSPERNTVLLGLLDKALSANLLYLDALEQGKDEDPAYREDLRRFADAILSGLYRSKHLVGDVAVGADEVDAFFRANFTPDTELTERLRTGIEATIRKAKFVERSASNRERLREGIAVTIDQGNLEPADDPQRADDTVLATVGEEPITWGETEALLTTLNNSISTERRVEALNDLIDFRLMARKAREAGLEQDPIYRKRMAELRKTALVTRHTEALAHGMEPTEDELAGFYEANKDRIQIPERRKVQMVVLETEDEANALKARIEAEEISLHEAAAAHSIDPNAKRTLGDFGWVTKGTGFPALDALTFSLEPGTLGGPVASPAGWHLVKVEEVRDARFTDFAQQGTRAATRRLLLKERLDAYVVDLRKDAFPVVVYQDNMRRLFQEEARWIAAKSEDMEAHPERAQQILDELREIVQ